MGFVWCFLMISLKWWYSGRETTEIRYYFITSCQIDILITWFMIIHVDLDHLIEKVFIRFLHHKVTPATHTHTFLCCTLWKEATIHSPYLRTGQLLNPSFRMECLQNSFDILLHGRFASSSHYLFQSFIYISTDW